MQNAHMRIVTNMRFHESAAWRAAVESIYPDHGQAAPARSPLAEAFQLWRKAPAHDAVLTMGARESLLYGALCLLTGRPSRQILSEIFLDQPRPHHPGWRVKEALFRRIAARSLGVLASSRHEQRQQAQRLGLPASRVLFVPLNANAVAAPAQAVYEPFVVAAGRSWRDYPTLLEALRGLDLPAHLFVGADDLPGASAQPGVTIHREADRATYLDFLARAAFAVVPLLPVDRATGQVVLLEAMALGKAVVATRAPGTVDYLDEGRTGLLVDPGDARALRAALLDLWNNPARARAWGENGRRDVAERFGIEQHAAAKLAAIRALLAAAPPAPTTRA